MTHWFSQSFRKVHLLYVSPQWANERGQTFDAAAYAEGYAQAGVDCVELYCKDHHGTTYYPCSLGIPYPRDVLGELLTELKKRDIRLIAYVSVCFDNYALGLHPEWRIASYLGDPYKLGPFYMASLCSPYADFVIQQIRELAENYEVDGFWLDIIPLARDVPQDPWMIAPHPTPDYSLFAQKRYYEQTGKRLPFRASGELDDELFEFFTAQVDRFLNRAYDTIRQYRPDAVITYNAAGAPGDPIDSATLTSIEGHAPYYARQSFISRWSKARSKPFEVMTAGGLPRMDVGGGWNGVDQKPATVMQLEAAIALAHGGSTLIGQAPYASGATDPAQFAGFAQVFNPIREIEPWLVEPTGVSDLALIVATKSRSASAHWGRMQDGAEAFHEAMLDQHLQYDVVGLDADLSKYQGIVMAEQTALSDAEIERVRAYVRGGGKLLASGRASLFDERGRERPDFGLADVFGVHYEGDSQAQFTYLRLRDADLRDRVTALPILIDQHALTFRLDGAQVIGDFVYPESHRTDATTVLWGDSSPDDTQTHPGITHHRYGQGECWYIGSTLKARGLPNAWVKLLMGVMARKLVTAPLLATNAPPGVEVTLNRQNGRYIVNLVNYHAGDADRLSFDASRMALRGLELRLNLARLDVTDVRRVYAAPDTALDYHLTDGWLTIALPPVSVHSVIAIE